MTQPKFDNVFFTAVLAASWDKLKADYPDYYTEDDYNSDEALEHITNVQYEGFKLFEVDSKGGEGQGDYAMTVWAVVPADAEPVRQKDKTVAEAIVYLRLEGFYSSYNGTDWDTESIQEVAPTPVVRTEWKRN